MKIISHILSLFLSGMKPGDISIELIFIILVFKAKRFLLITLLGHAVKAFNDTNAETAMRFHTALHYAMKYNKNHINI